MNRDYNIISPGKYSREIDRTKAAKRKLAVIWSVYGVLLASWIGMMMWVLGAAEISLTLNTRGDMIFAIFFFSVFILPVAYALYRIFRQMHWRIGAGVESWLLIVKGVPRSHIGHYNGPDIIELNLINSQGRWPRN